MRATPLGYYYLLNKDKDKDSEGGVFRAFSGVARRLDGGRCTKEEEEKKDKHDDDDDQEEFKPFSGRGRGLGVGEFFSPPKTLLSHFSLIYHPFYANYLRIDVKDDCLSATASSCRDLNVTFFLDLSCR